LLIDFDRKQLRILRRISRSRKNGITWGRLIQIYADDSNIFFLENLSKELYIVTQDENGKWIDFSKQRIDIHP